MKRNIMKLALLMILSVMVPFTLAAAATPDPSHPSYIEGQYAGSGSGTEIWAYCGFTADFVPNYNTYSGTWDEYTENVDVIYTFERGGKGTATGTGRIALLYNPTSPLSNVMPYADNYTFTWSFTYTLTPPNAITLVMIPGTYMVTTTTSGPYAGTQYQFAPLTRKGTVSPDGSTIVLSGGVPEVMTVTPNLGGSCGTTQMINNASRLLHRVR